MALAPSPPAGALRAQPSSAERTKVMLVDDSAVIRGFLARILSAEPDMDIVATASDGALAVAALKRTPAEVVILDVEMPNMDGLTAIPLLLAACPGVRIVMASTLTLKNATVSLKAISAGAADYLAKPTASSSFVGSGEFSRELVLKVRALGAASRRQSRMRQSAPSAPQASAKPLAVRSFMTQTPKFLAVGSSTGGPQALFTVLKNLVGVPQPILVTQHMPASFTTILADHITRQCGIPCVEATEGMSIQGGRIYLAPGGYHMVANKNATLSLNLQPPENYCRPSVDVMLRSLAGLGMPVLATILTGMGQDGLKGSQDIIAAGGSIIAQDEATSVVWGMPGMVANAGIASAVLPINAIGPKIRQLALRL